MRQLGEQHSNGVGRALPANSAERPIGRRSTRPGVLVVDDDYLVRVMLQYCLERHGFDVWLAGNGRDAINIYFEHREEIQLVLLAVSMPGLDGPQTMDALRSIDPGITACFMCNTNDYAKQELLDCGSALFVAKPFRLSDLANVLWGLTQTNPEVLLKWDRSHMTRERPAALAPSHLREKDEKVREKGGFPPGCLVSTTALRDRNPNSKPSLKPKRSGALAASGTLTQQAGSHAHACVGMPLQVEHPGCMNQPGCCLMTLL